MSAIRDNGGPAFPVIGAAGESDYAGMSLRDYFAACALKTMHISSSWTDNPLYWEDVARRAYVCADAMFEARQS
jgi:hypothetical protein